MINGFFFFLVKLELAVHFSESELAVIDGSKVTRLPTPTLIKADSVKRGADAFGSWN